MAQIGDSYKSTPKKLTASTKAGKIQDQQDYTPPVDPFTYTPPAATGAMSGDKGNYPSTISTSYSPLAMLYAAPWIGTQSGAMLGDKGNYPTKNINAGTGMGANSFVGANGEAAQSQYGTYWFNKKPDWTYNKPPSGGNGGGYGGGGYGGGYGGGGGYNNNYSGGNYKSYGGNNYPDYNSLYPQYTTPPTPAIRSLTWRISGG